LAALDPASVKVRRLKGNAFHRHVAVFDTWDDYWNGLRAAERALETSNQPVESLYRIPSPAQQYLTQTGRTLFKGMAFDDLHRLQLDIEVIGTGGFPNAARPADEVIIVALSDNRGWQQTLHSLESTEEALLRQTLDVVRALRHPIRPRPRRQHAAHVRLVDAFCRALGRLHGVRDRRAPRRRHDVSGDEF
jgi:hypothetical protein